MNFLMGVLYVLEQAWLFLSHAFMFFFGWIF